MAQETFFDKVREFIGSIAWSIFLWSIRMSEDQYIDAVVATSGLTRRTLDASQLVAYRGATSPEQFGTTNEPDRASRQ